ncbi:MAG TPA: hypothetical protein VFO40_15690 [Chthoniobacterales bacterium]|nr:hypothetical protein [Chthoniobacterales bacterium]
MDQTIQSQQRMSDEVKHWIWQAAEYERRLTEADAENKRLRKLVGRFVTLGNNGCIISYDHPLVTEARAALDGK